MSHNNMLTHAKLVRVLRHLESYSGPPFRSHECCARYLTEKCGFSVTKGNVGGLLSKADLLEEAGIDPNVLVKRGGPQRSMRMDNLEDRVSTLEGQLDACLEMINDLTNLIGKK